MAVPVAVTTLVPQTLGSISRVSITFDPLRVSIVSSVPLDSPVSSMSPLAVQMAKESVKRSFEVPLEEGLHFERKNFYMLFSSEDQKEGMNAFVEKRRPDFKGN